MNKKKINIILIPCAIIVWLVVLFRVLSYTGPAGTHFSENGRHIQVKDLSIQSDTLTLLLNYRDPFVPVSSFVTPKSVFQKETSVFRKPVEVTPPLIAYKGLIDPGENKGEIALTIIENCSFLLSKGDTIRGMKVINIFRDSVIFEYKSKLFTVKNTQQKKI